mmetsp:Transcript_6503/g.18157  ORF Transcript_6503/g.18157 Transcript_6503/m.18157 type:complete len:214 (-) Transcript_6503:1127-1768(-)
MGVVGDEEGHLKGGGAVQPCANLVHEEELPEADKHLGRGDALLLTAADATQHGVADHRVLAAVDAHQLEHVVHHHCPRAIELLQQVFKHLVLLLRDKGGLRLELLAVGEELLDGGHDAALPGASLALLGKLQGLAYRQSGEVVVDLLDVGRAVLDVELVLPVAIVQQAAGNLEVLLITREPSTEGLHENRLAAAGRPNEKGGAARLEYPCGVV